MIQSGEIMPDICLHKRIESETIHLPELRSLIGHDVMIRISMIPAKSADRRARGLAAAARIRDFNFAAVDEQDQLEWEIARGQVNADALK
jgi:hypothetical protein